MMYYMDNFKTANSLDYRLWKNRKTLQGSIFPKKSQENRGDIFS